MTSAPYWVGWVREEEEGIRATIQESVPIFQGQKWGGLHWGMKHREGKQKTWWQKNQWLGRVRQKRLGASQGKSKCPPRASSPPRKSWFEGRWNIWLWASLRSLHFRNTGMEWEVSSGGGEEERRGERPRDGGQRCKQRARGRPCQWVRQAWAPSTLGDGSDWKRILQKEIQRRGKLDKEEGMPAWGRWKLRQSQWGRQVGAYGDPSQGSVIRAPGG